MASDLEARVERLRMRNRLVLSSLASAGDDGSTPRLVTHSVMPAASGTVAGDSDLRAALAPYGFAIGFNAAGDGYRLDHETAVATEDFDRLTVELLRLLAPLGWNYDGWECAVVKPGA